MGATRGESSRSGTSSKVLIVDDNQAITEPLAYLLTEQGFAATVVHSGPEALDRLESLDPDIILLDLIMPVMSGLEVCRAVRTRSSVPVIILTATDSDLTKAVAAELGADDYLTKPFSARELVARMTALLNRSTHRRPGDPAESLVAGPVLLDLQRRLLWVRGRPAQVRPDEFALAEELLRHLSQTLSRGALTERLWGSVDAVSDRRLGTAVRRLRERIELDPAHPRHLTTVRGAGYRFDS